LESTVWSFNTLNPGSNDENISQYNDIIKIIPNPLNNSAKILINDLLNSPTELNIYNIYSEKVQSYKINYSNDAHHIINWNATELPIGVYFIELKQGNRSYFEKAVIVR